MDLNLLTDVFRTHIFSFQNYHIILIVCLIIDRINHGKQGQSILDGHVLLDFLYPILNLLCVGWFYLSTASAIRALSDFLLPSFLNGLLNGKPLFIQALGAFIIVDFMRYCTHYLSHKIPFLWKFHSIHHSAQDINSFTAYRLHAFEILIGTVISVLPVAVIGGSFESVMIVKLFDASWSYVVHTNCTMRIGLLGRILVTPQYHKIHHSTSKEHFDTNFSSHFILWDYIFGTRYTGNKSPVSYGISNFPVEPGNAGILTAVKYWAIQFIFPIKSLFPARNLKHSAESKI